MRDKLPPAPAASSPAVSAVMRGNRGADTRPELALRSELHSRGLRYRVHTTPVAGLRTRADIVFGPARTVVFVDGCFWHKCPEHGVSPSVNSRYWTEKLRRNVDRDRRVDEAFAQAGWLVIRVWEHEDPANAAERIERVVRGRRRRPRRAAVARALGGLGPPLDVTSGRSISEALQEIRDDRI